MPKSVSRRDVLKTGGTVVAAGGLAVLGTTAPPVAEPTKIRGKALLDRGEPEWYSGEELKFIGMPIGGLFAGTVYLGGDGQLWNWDIFNQERLGCVERPSTIYMGDTLNAMGGANYVDPVKQQSPFFQRFELTHHDRVVRFGDVRFRGEYPVGRVEYKQADVDVEMSLVAFSPFCPLDAEGSSYPATTMTFMVRNVGKEPLTLRMQHRSENPVLAHSRKNRSDFELRATKSPTKGVLFSAAELVLPKARADVLFEDWSSGTYGKWVATGTAFGDKPQRVDQLPSYMGPVHAGTTYVVNTHQTRNGEDVVKADTHKGRLRSPEFKIDRKFINLRVGGGNHKDGTCVNLIVEGKVVRSVTGKNSNAMAWEAFSVAEFEGKLAYLEVVDEVSGGWGQVSLGEVIFADAPRSQAPLAETQDNGTFCVEIVGQASPPVVTQGTSARVGREFTLAPGASETITFVVAWHFPNCAKNLPGKKHWYAKRWADAQAVAREIVDKWPQLSATTLAWNKTWYDSTLPYWFLDRTFMNTSILATNTCLRLDEGRYYFWEGVGCCAGTCTHVWNYAQAAARVFPEVERYLREKIDYGIAYRADTGAIDYRAEYHQVVAVDGQCGNILRTYREHTMCKDDTFLRGIWPQVKGSMQYLIRQDEDRDGILDGAQYNTLDTAWYGKIAWISSLYIAALRASEAMATEMGDAEFAAECGNLASSGSKKMVSDLFDGEYFFNRVDPKHPEANNTNIGCHSDQLFGQTWAHQLGLPRVVPAEQAKKALGSIFRYSFYEDIWEYRRHNKVIPGGRWYATPKEPGLIMCSFPKGGLQEAVGKSGDSWAVVYFNECWTGYEGQVAANMIAEGMVTEGLTIVRAIHERYHASKRNPYNEIECSDHYGRAMASYGAYVAMTGFQCHGPKKTMSFAPKVGGKTFRCAFIDARGWGTFSNEGGKETVTYRHKV